MMIHELRRLLEGLIKNPTRNNQLALADYFESEGQLGWATEIRLAHHSWEDISHHGSPTYQCIACNMRMYQDNYCDRAWCNVVSRVNKQINKWYALLEKRKSEEVLLAMFE